MLALLILVYVAIGARFAYTSWQSGFPFALSKYDYADEMNAAVWVAAWPVLYFAAR